MIARSTLYSSPGGDTTQIVLTAKYLRLLNVDVEIHLSNEAIDYTKFDIVHFFNIIRPDDILPHLFKIKLPFVVSTIFVDYFEYEIRNRTALIRFVSKILGRDRIEYLKTILRLIKNGERVKSWFYLLNGHKRSIRLIASKSSFLLPNSDSEYKRLHQSYNIEQQYKKVVNSIDISVYNDKVEADNKYKNHILCVGRIEGRKNQLNLIRALIDTDFYLTIIGKPSPNHLGYYDKCVSEASKNNRITFINHIDHENLAAIYKAAKVHVLPSWFETTGLSSLEAGVMGCNIVITKNGDTEEYFGDFAHYCEPDDINSIKEAVIKAYEEIGNNKLKNHIFSNYTWSKTAEQTLNAYKTICLN